MKTRNVLLFLLLPITCSCFGNSMLPPKNEPKAEVVVSAPVYAFLVEQHLRLFGHSTRPDVEQVICLAGKVSGNQILINALIPARITRQNEVEVHYEIPCTDHPDFIGTYHNHSTSDEGDGCWLGGGDDFSFGEYVTLISCIPEGKKMPQIMAWTRAGYSLLERR